jgi:hypothetical protein
MTVNEIICNNYNMTGFYQFLTDLWTYSATNSSGVQVEKSAFGIHLRFIGVSKVTGRIATARELGGSPLFSAANDFVS